MRASSRPPRWLLPAALVGLLLLAVGARLVLRDGKATGAAGVVPSPPVRASAPARPRPSDVSPTASARSSEPKRGTLLLHGAGDVSLDPDYIPAFRTQGYAHAWSGLGGLFQRDDLTVVNLECPATNGGSRWPGKQFSFRCDPAALPSMAVAGVEVANQGNNHAYDYGADGLLDSRTNILAAGIAPVGSGKDPAQAEEPALFDLNGWRVAVVGIDQVLDPEPQEQARPGHPGTACGHDVDCMVEQIRRAAARSDLVVVAIHWGVELDTQPRDYQVEEARRFIDAGADVIFGGHSHRLNPMGTYRGRPIFYSLGNFVWPNFSVAGSTTAVAEVVVKPDGTVSGRLIPAFIESPGHPVLRA